MKRFITFIAALSLLCICSSAQTPGEHHMKFNNIPIFGPIEDFGATMQKDGYTLVETTELGKLFRGAYLGFSDCSIYAITTPITQWVCKMSIYLPERTKWRDVKADYDQVKEFFKKGADNCDSFEFFVGGFRNGDGRELIALNTENASQESFFDVPNGTISVVIYSQSAQSAQVKILFEPTEGIQILQKEKDQMSAGL